MLNTYMVFSRAIGPVEGAALVFAHSCQEARRVGWKGIGCELTDDYLDLGAKRLYKHDWLYIEGNPKKLWSDVPHTVDSPRTCSRCELWGQSIIGEDGLCEECRDILAPNVEDA
jgi:hypothetical protein